MTSRNSMPAGEGDAERNDSEHGADSPPSKANTGGKQTSISGAETGVNVEDFLLPRSVIQRLAKGVLPPNTAIQRDALLAITKAATVFVSYLSSHANEETNKKTITPQDVLAALTEVEFDTFRPRLEEELAVYSEAAARKRRGKKDGKGQPNKGDSVGTGDDEPGNKRLKRTSGQEQVMETEMEDEGTDVRGNKGLDSNNPQREGSRPVDDSDNDDDNDNDDDTDLMEDTNAMDDEEESSGNDDEGRKEEGDDDTLPLNGVEDIDIESDASRRKGSRNGKHPDFDSNSDSDSDVF